MSERRVIWSVTPAQTKSPYIHNVAGALSEQGWTVDPLSLTDLMGTTGQIVHVQWPEHVSRGPSLLSTVAKHARTVPLLAALRLRNHAIVITAHNRAPHGESDAVDAWFRQKLHHAADGIIVLVPEHEDALRADDAVGPNCSVVKIEHPLSPPERLPELLSSSERDLLIILGQIHPYHQIEEFLAVLDANGATHDVLVAGGVGDEALAQRLTERSESNDRLTVRLGFADDDVLEPYLKRAMAIVSLQRHSFNSGGPFYALARNVPIVMSNGDQANHLARTVGSEWVFPVPATVNTMNYNDFSTWLKKPRTKPDLEAFDLEQIAVAHIELYELLRK